MLNISKILGECITDEKRERERVTRKDFMLKQ